MDLPPEFHGRLHAAELYHDEALHHPLDDDELKKPEIEEFIKLTSFDSTEFQHKWALLVFFANIYNYFTALYFIGIAGFPTDFWFSIEVGFELILVFDVVIRLWIYKAKHFKVWWVMKEKTHFILLLIASFPQSFLFAFLGAEVDLSAQWIAWVRTLKLLRYFQIRTFLVNQETVHKKLKQAAVLVLRLFLILFGITHFSAMLWLIVARNERALGADDTWYDVWNM
jgi:hypothetical protein